MAHALICGLAGPDLTPAEVGFLREVRPCGVILFARNLVAHDQIRRLVGEARAAVGEACLVLIDQEGGRVQRLRPPLGRALPRAAAYGRLHDADPAGAVRAARLVARLMAADLKDVGIDTDCVPVLDVPQPGAHPIIGDRAYATSPAAISALGRAVVEGMIAGGILPVVKHIPGHGRAQADSHLELPVVTSARAELSAVDFEPFRALRHAPAAMTAHVVYTAVDDGAAASISPIVHRDVIRGEIGFDGFLMSDDLGMKALGGSFLARAEAVIAAGSDCVLHCSGDLAEMTAVAAGAPVLAGRSLERYQAACEVRQQHEPLDRDAAEVVLARILALDAAAGESV